MASAVVVEDLHESYGAVRAVDGASFGVERGQIFALLGRNGAEKTTTVEILRGAPRTADALTCSASTRSTGPRRALREGTVLVLQDAAAEPDSHDPRDHRPQSTTWRRHRCWLNGWPCSSPDASSRVLGTSFHFGGQTTATAAADAAKQYCGLLGEQEMKAMSPAQWSATKELVKDDGQMVFAYGISRFCPQRCQGP
ncbi:ATP-binding cassette domain-containing protein [Streptomyces sp. NPDC056682]|uniref:ATP-binding cassette domain-containing protein n=1 Tax=Streptomyces sp. NPDC056682 TaxID=3345909 RepID=UPI0036B1E7A0